MKTKLIIFDFDGVIIDSLPLTKHIYQRYADEFDVQWLSEKLSNPSGIKDFFELDWKKNLSKLEIHSEEKISQCINIFKELSHEFSHLSTIQEGMIDVLDELKKKYTLAIVSNNFKAIILNSLKRFGLLDEFSIIVGAEDGNMKPAPDLILRCCDIAGFKPKESVFIGDMEGDIIAGKSAKVKKVIGVTYGYHTKKRLSDADVLVDSPGEILGVVE